MFQNLLVKSDLVSADVGSSFQCIVNSDLNYLANELNFESTLLGKCFVISCLTNQNSFVEPE